MNDEIVMEIAVILFFVNAIVIELIIYDFAHYRKLKREGKLVPREERKEKKDKKHRWIYLVPVLIGTIICVLISYKFSTPVPGLGIAMPIFVAPVVSALVAIGLAFVFPGSIRTVIAYVSGVLGVLIGADLLNINKIKSLGAPTASIGGAGTFDGIFLTGILAVLLV
jgi:hypothetical protein